MSLIPLYHPQHGEAVADEAQLAAMQSEGWSKTKPKTPSKGKNGTPTAEAETSEPSDSTTASDQSPAA